VQLFENKQSALSIKHYLGYISDTSHNQASGLLFWKLTHHCCRLCNRRQTNRSHKASLKRII